MEAQLSYQVRQVAGESARTVGWIDSPLMYGSLSPLQKAQNLIRFTLFPLIICREDYGQHTVWGP